MNWNVLSPASPVLAAPPDSGSMKAILIVSCAPAGAAHPRIVTAANPHNNFFDMAFPLLCFWAPLMATSAVLLIGRLIESILVHLAHPSKACLRGDVTRVGLQLSHSVNW